MMIKKVDHLQTLKIECHALMIQSCLDGMMGDVFFDESLDASYKLEVGDFCFLVGKPSVDLIFHKPDSHVSDFIIMVPENDEWAKLIEKTYQTDAKQVTRYALKTPDCFDLNYLQSIVSSLDESFQIKKIDQTLYHEIMRQDWSRDLCLQFLDANDYVDRGLGFVILKDNEIVSGASSYVVFKEGIEIEIDTREDMRRLGLASICGARLIIECYMNNKIPHWDAQNIWSKELTEKLGYIFDYEYKAYEISKYGHTIDDENLKKS